MWFVSSPFRLLMAVAVLISALNIASSASQAEPNFDPPILDDAPERSVTRGDSSGSLTGGMTSRSGDGGEEDDEATRRIRTDLVLCNYLNVGEISLAYAAYIQPDWRIRGWVKIPEGTCKLIVRKGVDAYIYAEAEHSDTLWSGWTPLCIHPRDAFDHTDDVRKCPDGYEVADFRHLPLDLYDLDRDGIYYTQFARRVHALDSREGNREHR